MTDFAPEDTQDNELQSDELLDLQFAALLHDIGKFWQRTGCPHDADFDKYTEKDYGSNDAHSKWSAAFVQSFYLPGRVQKLALFHHQPASLKKSRLRALTTILQKADQFSSSESFDQEEMVSDTPDEPLVSIFSRISLHKGPKKPLPLHYYPLRPLDVGNLPFPSKSKQAALEGLDVQKCYEHLWQAFTLEVENVPRADRVSQFTTLYYLLKKYTSFMPSGKLISQRDVPLFDHLKTTTALASCLYLALADLEDLKIDDSAQLFLFVSGDISGIQGFIYSAAQTEQARKGLARRLRGRSFYLTLLTDIFARALIERFHLSETNILWCSGGNFFIVAPNTKQARQVLESFEREVNDFLFNKFKGKLFLALASGAASGTDLRRFSQIKENLVYESGRKKRQKFQEHLEDVFSEELEAPAAICRRCGNPTDTEEWCEDCDGHENLGRTITRAKYAIRAYMNKHPSVGGFDINELGIGYKFFNNAGELHRIRTTLDSASAFKAELIVLNDTNFLLPEVQAACSNTTAPIGFEFSLLANAVPIDPAGRALSFQDISRLSLSVAKLGILQMDVDDLGMLFASGLGELSSIARTTALSSSIDLFFSGYLNNLTAEHYVLSNICSDCRSKVKKRNLKTRDFDKSIVVWRELEFACERQYVCQTCAQDKITTIYTTYAGGDDLLLIGPWDSIYKLARDVRDAFRRYTCWNPDVTISAGIFLSSPIVPLGTPAALTAAALDKSKTEGKDKITAFSETVNWDSEIAPFGYSTLIDFAERLEVLAQNKKISRPFVDFLRVLFLANFDDTLEMTDAAKNKKRRERSQYVPAMKFMLATEVKDAHVRNELDKTLVTRKMLPWIQIPASIFTLRKR
jgi:CRISPR-associated protein Csm1